MKLLQITTNPGFGSGFCDNEKTFHFATYIIAKTTHSRYMQKSN